MFKPVPPLDHTIRRVIGPTILLGSGNYYDYENPEDSVITIEDFAYGLAFQSRFSGQCVSRRTGLRVYYAIAQHCVIGSEQIEDEYSGTPELARALAYDFLMHEAGEPVCHDVNAPLKSMLSCYRPIEKRCEAANLAHFQVAMQHPDIIKEADMRMFATERRDIMRWNGERWNTEDRARPYAFEIEPVGPYEAAEAFIHRYNALAPQVLSRGGIQHG